MPQEQIIQALLGGALPFVAAAVVVFTAGGLWRASTRAKVARFPTVLAIVIALLASRLALSGWPEAKWEYILFVLAGAGAVALVGAALPARWWLQSLIALIGAGIAGWLMQPVFAASDPSWLRIAPFVLIAVITVALAPVTARRPGPLLPAVFFLWMSAATAASVLSGNITIALVAAAGASAIFAVFMLALFRRGVTASSGAVLILSTTAVGTLLLSYLYSYDLDGGFIVGMALAALTPLPVWLGELRAFKSRPFTRGLVILLGPALIAAAALTLILLNSDLSAYG